MLAKIVAVGLNGGPGSMYFLWNDAIASRFFNPAAAGEQVYLYVTDEVITEVGRGLGGLSMDHFVASVRAGPPGTTRAGHCQRALQVAQGWRGKSLTYPPYVAYLALFVLAGGQEGEFAPHAYYPRVWRLLGEEGEGSPPSFDRMSELWYDLEHWSTHDRAGNLGVFEARVVGGWVHVGMPIAQTILTEAERAALPGIFADGQLEAGTAPSTRDLRRALVQHGRHTLRPRTVTALERGSEAFKEALLDVVAHDFLEWDGMVRAATLPNGRTAVHASLRLCLDVDRVAGTATVTLRCYSQRELPEAGLRFEWLGRRVRCGEYVPHWSSTLEDESGAPFAPPPTIWEAGATLADEGGWRLRLRTARLRLFIQGAHAGLPGLIETPHLPTNGPFYLAFRPADWPDLSDWALQECEGWHDLPISTGFPAGWRLATAALATTDSGPRRIEATSAFPDRASLRLVGGIRSAAAGSSFFSFAPPRVAAEGLHDDDIVASSQLLLSEDRSSPGIFDLPKDLPGDARYTVEIRREGEPIARTSLYLVAGFAWRFDAPAAGFDRFGTSLGESMNRRGILGATAPPPHQPLPPDVLRTPGIAVTDERVFFVGNRPGAIARWPAEGLPAWQPVWAIPFRRRGRAIYCGTSLATSRPVRKPQGTRGQRALWRRVLWQWRRRITPPLDGDHKALWRKYQQVARAG